jgi:hypothetical protein
VDAPTEETIDQLAQEFPDWNIWATHNEDGTPATLMATRRRDLTQAELNAGLARTLPMGFFGGLRTQLAEQERRKNALGGGA